jgi:hypothetical protein
MRVRMKSWGMTLKDSVDIDNYGVDADFNLLMLAQITASQRTLSESWQVFL